MKLTLKSARLLFNHHRWSISPYATVPYVFICVYVMIRITFTQNTDPWRLYAAPTVARTTFCKDNSSRNPHRRRSTISINTSTNNNSNTSTNRTATSRRPAPTTRPSSRRAPLRTFDSTNRSIHPPPRPQCIRAVRAPLHRRTTLPATMPLTRTAKPGRLRVMRPQRQPATSILT